MTKKRLVTTVILLGLVAVLGLLSLAQPVAPKGIIINPPDPTGLTVRVWVDKGAYAVGEKIQIHYEVNQDAYVYIYDIDADGKVSMIFPNYYSQNNYVAAGEHVLPDSPTYNLTVVEPIGTEYLQAIASAQPLNLAPQFQITIPFPFMGADPDALKIQIQGQIMGIVPDPQWAQDWTNFEVVSGTPPAYGALIINSVPSGAWITIDGHYAGYTPRTLYITQGYHQISLSKTGYEDWNHGLFVIGGQTRTVNAALTPIAQVNQPPVAAFNFSPTNPLVGSWVQFNGSASSDPDGTITSYAWNFGDGGTGSGVSRYHQFAAPGTYTVSLTVTDDDGATDTEIHTIQVGSINQSPVAAFNFSPTNPLVGSWVQFNGSASSDPDGTITSYAWNFGDGGTGSGVSRYHQFAAPGTYTVSLTVTDDDGATDTEIHTIQVGSINQSPVAAFTTPPSPGVSEWVRFDGSASYDPDGSISTYAWNFGDGGTGSGVTPYHRFAAPGTYTVTLTVTDDDGATDTEIHTVQVGPVSQAPVAAFTYAPLSPGIGDTIVLNATSSYDPDGVIVSYSWDLDANGTTDTTGQIVSFSYYSVGPHTVRLTVVDNDGLSGTTTQMINVAGGGVPGKPPMGGTPGIFVWGTDTWHITVNAGAHWTSAHSYRLEFRTDKSFSGVNQATSGGVVPLGVIPTPTDGGKTLVFEGSLQNGSVDYTFTTPQSESIWMSLKLDIDGNGTLDESTSFVYLRTFMVHPPKVPFVVGLQKGDSGPLVPSINFRVGTALTYTASVRFLMWITNIATLEGP